MVNLACLNWSNLQECRFNRIFDPLTLWILTMQLNWYRCNLVNPVPYMAAIASPFYGLLACLTGQACLAYPCHSFTATLTAYVVNYTRLTYMGLYGLLPPYMGLL